MDFLDLLSTQNIANHILGLEDDFDTDEDEDDDEIGYNSQEEDSDSSCDNSNDVYDDDDTNTHTFTYESTVSAVETADPREEQQIQQTQKTTRLFDAIEKQYWSATMSFLTTGRWTKGGFLQGQDSSTSDSARIPLKEEARTWSVILEKSGKVTDRLLPLHAALMHNAPIKVIKLLVELYPEALSCADTRGNLPLHLAYEHGAPTPVLIYLQQVYPEAKTAENHRGDHPTDCSRDAAATTGSFRRLGSGTVETPNKLAQIAAKVSPRWNSADEDVRAIKNELAELRKGFSGDERDASSGNPHERALDHGGWMESISKLQNSLLGTKNEATHQTQNQAEQSEQQTCSMARWKRSLRVLTSGDGLDNRNDEQSLATAHESVEMNLTEHSTASSSKSKKSFPFYNPFRNSSKSSVLSRDTRPQTLVSYLSGIQEDMEALSMGGVSSFYPASETPSVASTTGKKKARGRSFFGIKKTTQLSRTGGSKSPANSALINPRTRSKSPARRKLFSRPSRDNMETQRGPPSARGSMASEATERDSSTPKRGNRTESPGRLFRKRSYAWILRNSTGAQNVQPMTASPNDPKKRKNAHGKSTSSASGFTWDFDHSGFAEAFLGHNPTKSTETIERPRDRSPFNPSFLENSLLVSPSAQRSHSISKDNNCNMFRSCVDQTVMRSQSSDCDCTGSSMGGQSENDSEEDASNMESESSEKSSPSDGQVEQESAIWKRNGPSATDSSWTFNQRHETTSVNAGNSAKHDDSLDVQQSSPIVRGKSYRRFKSLGSVGGSSTTRRQRMASLGSFTVKSEEPNEKAARLWPLRGFLRRKNSSVTPSSDEKRSSNIPAFLTSNKSRMFETRQPEECQGRPVGVEGNVAQEVLPVKGDWRQEYQAYLSSTSSNASRDKGPASSAKLAATIYEQTTSQRTVGLVPREESGKREQKRRTRKIKRAMAKRSNRNAARFTTQHTFGGALEILNDSEKSTSSSNAGLLDFRRKRLVCTGGNELSSDQEQGQPLRPNGTGPVVSETNISTEYDGSNVYLVRVQF